MNIIYGHEGSDPWVEAEYPVASDVVCYAEVTEDYEGSSNIYYDSVTIKKGETTATLFTPSGSDTIWTDCDPEYDDVYQYEIYWA